MSTWMRLECKMLYSGWTSRLPGEQYACWVKLLQAVKLIGERGGRIKEVQMDDAQLAAWHMERADFDAMVNKALEKDALRIAGDYIYIVEWPKYQKDPTAAGRMAKYRSNKPAAAAVEEIPPEPDVPAVGGIGPPPREWTPANGALSHIQERFLAAYQLRPDLEVIPSLEKWVTGLITDGGGGHPGMLYVQSFEADDFIAGWTAFVHRKKRSQRWNGKWVQNARRARKTAVCKRQEAEAAKDRQQGAGPLTPEVAALIEPAGKLTEAQQREAGWSALAPAERTKLIAKARKEIGVNATTSLTEQTAKMRWWNESQQKS